LEGTAALLSPDRPGLALRLGGAAAALRERTRQPLTPGEQEALSRRLDEARRRLDPGEAARRWAQGAGAPTEGAIPRAGGARAAIALPHAEREGDVPGSTSGD